MSLVIGLLLVLALFTGLRFCIIKMVPFINNRRYIKMELERADSEREYRHWQREMRRLYADAMPVLRLFMKL